MATTPHTHVVRSGDCIESIAAEVGCAWSDLWEHERNATLRRERRTPTMLVAGDVVQIPDELRPAPIALPKGGTHRFQCAPAWTMLTLRLQHRTVGPTSASIDGVAGIPFRVIAGRVTVEGTTTADGDVEARIPAAARFARVELEPGTPRERVLDVHVGDLDPHDAGRGVEQRLVNLGLLAGSGDASPEALAEAIARFQHDHGLDVTGEVDAETLERLRTEHDGE